MKPDGLWRKPTRCGEGGDCVEVAFTGEGVGIRDSKRLSQGALSLTPGQWQDLIDRVKTGELDTPQPA